MKDHNVWHKTVFTGKFFCCVDPSAVHPARHLPSYFPNWNMDRWPDMAGNYHQKVIKTNLGIKAFASSADSGHRLAICATSNLCNGLFANNLKKMQIQRNSSFHFTSSVLENKLKLTFEPHVSFHDFYTEPFVLNNSEFWQKHHSFHLFPPKKIIVAY